MDYHSAIKRTYWLSYNKVDEPRAYYTEWSKSEKQTSYINAYTWNLERWYWWTYFQGRNGDTDIKNRLVDMVEGRESGMNWGSNTEPLNHTLWVWSSVMSDSVTPWTAACQASLSITNSQVYSDSCPLSQWCHPAISSSVVPFSSCPQSFPASWSFQMRQYFTSDGQSVRVSASASVLPMNIQDWFPFRLTGLISFQSKGLSRVFSNITIQKHPFFSVYFPLSFWSNSHIHTWLMEKQ